jgi:hypothetical protein
MVNQGLKANRASPFFDRFAPGAEVNAPLKQQIQGWYD